MIFCLLEGLKILLTFKFDGMKKYLGVISIVLLRYVSVIQFLVKQEILVL